MFGKKKDAETPRATAPRSDEPAVARPSLKTDPLSSPRASVPQASAADLPRRVPDIPAAGGGFRRAAETGAAARGEGRSEGAGEVKKLIVGRDIFLSGEIKSCNKLVVEGSVEAALRDCQTVEIADAGLFRGSAEIDTADVSGRFEGDLTVRSRLVIRTTGRITGTVRYGQIEIERGGVISGQIEHIASAAAGISTSPGSSEGRESAQASGGSSWSPLLDEGGAKAAGAGSERK
jgi:cytoskeletal protein CcmA (bactofilin family)